MFYWDKKPSSQIVDRIPDSTLNLKLYIKEKGVRDAIWRKLSPIDWMLVLAAHSLPTERTIKGDKKFLFQCAKAGYVDLLRWIVPGNCLHLMWDEKGGLVDEWGFTIRDMALSHGCLLILQWIKELDPEHLFTERDFSLAGSRGHLDVLQNG